MISITPQGSVYLCKTPLENDYKNQLTFANATAQQTYFANTVVKTGTDYTYIKKDNTIIVNYPIDEIIDCNYLFYINTGFSTKYYYCFITNMEYVNENATRLTIETDVFQTYQFNIVKKSCFVEREHVNDDTLGLNTVPENLDTGEYVINTYNKIDYEVSGTPETRVVIGVTKVPEDMYNTFSTSARQYNGIFGGLTYYVFQSFTDAANFIAVMDLKALADNVVNVFLAPSKLCNTMVFTPYTETIIDWGSTTFDITFNYNKIPTESAERVLLDSTTIAINTTLNGYTPKNNKLFTGEFNYLLISNNNGNSVKYNYEDFVDNSPIIRVIGAICPGCSIRLIPENYKKYTTTSSKNALMEYGLVAGKYPVCSWRSDTYTNWLTQQSVNYQVTAGDIVGMGLGAILSPTATLATAAGGIISGLMSDPKAMKREISPVQAKGNINVGDVTYSSGNNRFIYMRMSCRYEYAKRIDDYFSMFGYKVNSVKIPNLTGRTNWNYVKTVDCNFEGDIPQMYLNKIKEIFNNGITLWHNASTFLDYSQSNTIVS